MRTETNPYHPIYLLINSQLALEKSLPLVVDSIENEIIIQSKDESQHFNSSQSRLQYLFSTGKITKELFQKITLLKSEWEHAIQKETYDSAISIWAELISASTNISIPEDLKLYRFSESYLKDKSGIPPDQFIKSSRISILKYEHEKQVFDFIFEKGTAEIHSLSISGLPVKKSKLLLQALKFLKFPFDLFAHQLVKENNLWKAEEFIILPDFLIDVTAIASCYNNHGVNPQKHLIHLYYYTPAGFSTLVGTSVNQFLDELILNPKLNFDEVSQNLFQHNPIAFSLLNDVEVLKYHDTIKTHFQNIKHIVDSNFNQLVDQLENCLMEPSFYSVEYGIQGRLDVFHEKKESKEKLIIELKSGKPFLPNKFQINADHHAQIMLYYLLIQSVFGSYQEVQCQLLYSSQTEKALRHAPVIEEIKQELIYLRNAIVLLHLHLAFRKPADPFILDLITDKHYHLSESYTKRDAGIILNIYSSLNQLEKDYFKELSGFIAREQFIAKMGRAGSQFTEGLASLWLLTEHEKITNFMLLHGLIIRDIIQAKGEFPILVLVQPPENEFVSNFRTGDTLVLYSGTSALKEQIYKCTLIEIFPNEYHIRLRTRQFPDFNTAKQKKWNLEHDSLDRSFINQFQGLLEFAQADNQIRQRIMGIIPSRIKDEIEFEVPEDAPEMIQVVLKKILQSKDYFLLWGPPGSGKTSIVIKHLTQAILSGSSENILLLAYTNRAVDEICEAIESVEFIREIEYIRIGSRFAVAPKFRKNLLEEKISQFKTRKQVQQLLKNTRIFTATISSIQGKKELFYLKKFDTVIIDEASQILESQLCGLLHRFNRFILIGDHMQLPAVTAQTEEECRIHSDTLIQTGFQSLNMSLFERLLHQCKDKGWDHAYEMLQYQGRMHEDLMKFPGALFYENKLQILPFTELNRQSQTYSELFKSTNNDEDQLLTSNRTIFIHCENLQSLPSSKTNLAEAKMVCSIIRNIHEVYQKNNRNWNEFTLGVITPFRAQIAQIKKQLHEEGLDSISMSVDTAERYQGSTRDIIILSTVISEEHQLGQISSINLNGVDRKLNVALTRAKEQIILIGNKHALNASPLYRQLINDYSKWDIKY